MLKTSYNPIRTLEIEEMVRTREQKERVGKRGLAYYEDKIAPQLTNEDRGRYIAIDVNTGEWEIDDTHDATDRLTERLPDADVFLLRHIDIVTGYFGSAPKELFE